MLLVTGATGTLGRPLVDVLVGEGAKVRRHPQPAGRRSARPRQVVEDEQPSRYRGDSDKEIKDAAVGSGLEWGSLRAGSFAINTLHAWGAQIRAGDVVRGPYATFAEAPIHERDLAGVAARALLTDELVGRRLELTGPPSLTHEEMVAIIGDLIAQPLHYQEMPPEVASRAWSSTVPPSRSSVP